VNKIRKLNRCVGSNERLGHCLAEDGDCLMLDLTWRRSRRSRRLLSEGRLCSTRLSPTARSYPHGHGPVGSLRIQAGRIGRSTDTFHNVIPCLWRSYQSHRRIRKNATPSGTLRFESTDRIWSKRVSQIVCSVMLIPKQPCPFQGYKTGYGSGSRATHETRFFFSRQYFGRTEGCDHIPVALGVVLREGIEASNLRGIQ